MQHVTDLGFQFNGREIAVLIWIAILLVPAIGRRETRRSLLHVLKTAANPKVLTVLQLYVVYVTLEVWIGFELGWWHRNLTKDTLVWLLIGGFPVFMTFTDAGKMQHFFRGQLRNTLGVVVLVEYFVGTYVFYWAIEFALQPILVALVYGSVAGGQGPDRNKVKQVCNTMLATFGAFVLLHVLSQVVDAWPLDWRAQLPGFTLPLWLTLLLLPFVFLVALYAEYESAWTQTRFGARTTRDRLRAWLALALVAHVRLYALHKLTAKGAYIAGAESFKEAVKRSRQVLRMRREEGAARRAEQRALRDNAGHRGTDADGRPLDRREFKETKQALDWLATCQMGWYARNGGRYPPDLIERFQDDFGSQGLPAPAGIVLEVAEDGQAWYAWRRTPCGHCFAIGAGVPPTSLWHYDGAGPPTAFPGRGPPWGAAPFDTEAAPNWDL